MIQLNYRDSKPIYEQIKDGLRKLIITNSLSVNEKLPSVRELASGLAINPNTIQRAYRELESEGFIYSLPGKGSFVAEKAAGFAHDARTTELLTKFDGVVEELYFLSVDEETLKRRIADDIEAIRSNAASGKHDSTSKKSAKDSNHKAGTDIEDENIYPAAEKNTAWNMQGGNASESEDGQSYTGGESDD